jgi:RNA polymerase sigma factor (sigma-70 family)
MMSGVCDYDIVPPKPGMEVAPEHDIEQFRPKVRFRIAHHLGFACPDLDDLVQDCLTRLLLALRERKVRDPEALAAFLNGICRNVILEYRRRRARGDLAEEIPEQADKRLSGASQFELREAIAQGMGQLSARDREILRAFYIEEKPKEQIQAQWGLTYDQFRVVLCRAKERFRAIYKAR